MPVNEEIQGWLNDLKTKSYPRLSSFEPHKARQIYNRAFDSRLMGHAPANRQDITIRDDLTVAIYRSPRTPTKDSGALVYYHGGGFVFGDLNTHDEWCRFLANEANCIIVSVDYRLAPENPFPAAVDDAWFALNWVGENAETLGINPGRIAVGGDSAGGNLAAVMTIMARELPTQHTPSIIFQMLLYMTADMSQLASPTYDEFATGYFMEKSDMIWFREQYLGDQDPKDWRASPILAGTLRALPRAFVVTAECDVLRHEGEAYAKALIFAGNKVTVKRYNGMIHGFAIMPQFDSTEYPRKQIAAILQQAIAPTTEYE